MNCEHAVNRRHFLRYDKRDSLDWAVFRCLDCGKELWRPFRRHQEPVIAADIAPEIDKAHRPRLSRRPRV